VTRTRRDDAAGRPNVAVIAALAVIGIALLAVVLVSVLGGDDDGETSAGDTIPTPGASLSPECQQIHEGHNVMSWNPTMADEMAECAWPYDPFLSTLEGGEADPAFDDVAFESHLYQEVWDLVGAADLGICSVATLPDQPEAGFAFGFSYDFAAPGCPEATPTGSVVVREYSTRDQRDAAGHALATEGFPTFVLGRWVVVVEAEDFGPAATLSTALTDLGAVEVTAE
jgi:hypothetical protein